jgi:hypothetical protein
MPEGSLPASTLVNATARITARHAIIHGAAQPHCLFSHDPAWQQHVLHRSSPGLIVERIPNSSITLRFCNEVANTSKHGVNSGGSRRSWPFSWLASRRRRTPGRNRCTGGLEISLCRGESTGGAGAIDHVCT